MNKKERLDYLFYKIGNQQSDFYLCGLFKIHGEIKATKWLKYSDICFPLNPWEDEKIDYINQRQILPNEIVLDLEDKVRINEIIKTLKEKKALFYAYATGSKGYHIHIFFKKELTEKQKFKVIQHYGADIQKASSKTMIALELVPHWKSGKIKELI